MFNNSKVMLAIIQKQTKTIDELTKETRLLNDIRHRANEDIKKLKEENIKLKEENINLKLNQSEINPED